MTENGFLNRDEKSGEYSLSLKLFEIGVKATKATNYPRLITSELEKLASSLQVVAQFSVEDNGELLCLQSIDPENMNPFPSIPASAAVRLYTQLVPERPF